jgi:hypothetical protein
LPGNRALVLLLKSLSDHFSKFHVVTSVIERPKQWTSKRARKNQEFFIKETPKLLYSVVINNRSQKKEVENKPDQDAELGLPPQPTAYLKYPDCDWL